MNSKQSILLLSVLFIFTNLLAQKKNNPPEKPKLIIGIVVEEMREEYLYRYQKRFEEKGFNIFLNEGTKCPNTSCDYLYPQSGVSHATISTGAFPSKHGIVSTTWFDRSQKKIINCIDDEQEITVGGWSNAGNASARNLMVTTIGDELKMSSAGKSKVFSISMKNHSAIYLAGHNANAAYWFDKKTGNWISSTYYLNSLPAWVSDFNFKKAADLYIDRQWATIFPLHLYRESLPDDNKFETGFFDHYKTFPYPLPELKKYENDYSIMQCIPFGNTLTKDFAASLVINEELGKDNATDILFISFSPSDFLGNYFDPMSIEMQDLYVRLDMEIYNFINFIDNQIGNENVLYFLTSDHGRNYSQEYLKENKIPCGEYNYKTAYSLLQIYLRAIYGNGDWLSAYTNRQFYLNQKLIDEKNIKAYEIQKHSADILDDFEGVLRIFTSNDIEEGIAGNELSRKAANSYFNGRSGNMLVTLMAGWIDPTVENGSHGTYEYDSQVPLYWYGWKTPEQTINRAILLNDIAPTISEILKISAPSAASGTPIWEVIK